LNNFKKIFDDEEFYKLELWEWIH